MEIFNLRNDRYEFPDQILNYLIIKKLILKKKFKKVKIISDNKVTLNMFDNLNVEIKKKNLSKFNFQFRLPHLKLIKFLIKAIILVFYCKLLKFYKREKSEKNTYYLSLYPNKYFYGKENFFEKKKNNFKFFMSDETHLNFNKENYFILQRKQMTKKL